MCTDDKNCVTPIGERIETNAQISFVVEFCLVLHMIRIGFSTCPTFLLSFHGDD